MRCPRLSIICRCAALAAFASGLPAPAAHAQAGIAEARSAVAAELAEAERNFIFAEGVQMHIGQFNAKQDNLNERVRDINQRIVSLTAYCTGTFPEPEYSARKAQCDSLQSQYDALGRQMALEQANLDDLWRDIEARKIERDRLWTAIVGRLTSAMQGFVIQCLGLSAAEFEASCHVPPAPGPRTVDLVRQLDIDFREAAQQLPNP